MNADEYLKGYLPDFDTAAMRSGLAGFDKDELIERLIMARKDACVAAMLADHLSNQLSRIQKITEEPELIPSVDRPPSNFS